MTSNNAVFNTIHIGEEGLVLTQDTIWNSTHRYELRGPVTILPGVQFAVLGLSSQDPAHLVMQTAEASISVREGASLQLQHVLLEGNDLNTKAFKIFNVSRTVEVVGLRCQGRFDTCIELHESFDSTVAMRDSHLSGARHGLVSSARSGWSQDVPYFSMDLQNVTCLGLRGNCIFGGNMFLTDVEIRGGEGPGIVLASFGTMMAQRLQCWSIPGGCLAGLYGAGIMRMEGSIVADCGAIIQTGSYHHQGLEMVGSLILRNTKTVDAQVNFVNISDSIIPYNQQGFIMDSCQSSISSTLFLGNDVAISGLAVAPCFNAESAKVSDSIFYGNKNAVSAQEPWCTIFSNVTFLENDVSLYANVAFEELDFCSGGIHESNCLNSKTAHVSYDGLGTTLSLENLYWGTTNVTDIRPRIVDVFSDPSFGVVNIEPIAQDVFAHPMLNGESPFIWTPPLSFLEVSLEATAPPSVAPTFVPTNAPIVPTMAPTGPTNAPTFYPTLLPAAVSETQQPAATQTREPSTELSFVPTNAPGGSQPTSALRTNGESSFSETSRVEKILLVWNGLLTVVSISLIIVVWYLRK